MESRNEPWVNIYTAKLLQEVRWIQQITKSSMEFMHSFHLPKSASNIEIGTGDSWSENDLLCGAYEFLNMPDIPEKSGQRLGSKASKVNWNVRDVAAFHPHASCYCWNDRAAFHFLTNSRDDEAHLSTARKSVSGFLACSTLYGKSQNKSNLLDGRQYAEVQLNQQLQKVLKISNA